jgi:nucleoside-triphosphatase
MRFLVSGPPGSGKSTLILRLIDFLKEKNIKVGGIISPEVRKENVRIGFKVVDLLTLKEKQFASVNYKTNYKVGKYCVDVKLFEEIAIPALEIAERECKVIAIDEIGKMELFSKKFEEKVKEILSSNKIVIAAVHGNYLNEYKKYGKLFWLERERWNEIYNSIASELQKII